MEIVKTVKELRQAVQNHRKKGEKIGLAPTMGNLHAGHISLTHTLRDHVDTVIVTIFVNPKQFGENEDFGSYPRTLEADLQKLKAADVEIVYIPDVSEIYPTGFATNISVSSVSQGLCGAARPGHFDGVCTVVTKLLLQALPDVATFGEKDFQQLAVINRFVIDLDIPVKIISSPILREADGLAMSSRNNYLSQEARQIAPKLYENLLLIRDMARCQSKKTSTNLEPTLELGKKQILKAGFDKIDYLEIRDVINLEPTFTLKPNTNYRLFVAAYLDKTRLIDNIPLIQL